MSVYTVTSPLVVLRGDDGGQRHLYEGGTFASEGVDKDQLKQLVDSGMVKKGDSAPDASDAGGGTKPPKVDDILKEVGDDKAKAQAALEAEQARGDDARSTLVEKLSAIVGV